jgi:putative transcriptional regulator
MLRHLLPCRAHSRCYILPNKTDRQNHSLQSHRFIPAAKLKKMNKRIENFPEMVKALRKQLGLSQEDLAHALGVSFATVNRWENGKTSPSRLALRQLEAFRSEHANVDMK